MAELTWLAFVLTSMVIILSPGPDMLLVLSRALGNGTRAGLITAAGISTGLLGHTLLATLGLGVLLKTSALAFEIMKTIGALYLVFLGIRALRSKAQAVADTRRIKGRARAWFMQGILCNLTNPKIAVFYLAYLPQFVRTDSPNAGTHLLLLGIAFSLLAFLIKAPIGLLAGRFSLILQHRPGFQNMLNRLCGSVLILMGVRLLISTRA